MRVTIKDIAKEFGVSTAAVSKALNNNTGISEELREKIKKYATDIGYTPNVIARNLVNKNSNKIALFLLSRNKNELRLVSAGMELISYIIEEANKFNDNILIFTINDDQIRNYLELCNSENVKGAIIFGVKLNDPQIEELRKNKNFPIVCFETNLGGNVNSVKTDNYIGITKVIEYLKEKKYTKIGLITGHFNAQVTKERLNCFIEKIGYENLEIFEGDFTKESGYQGAKYLYSKNIKCIFSFSDIMALGAMMYFNENGIKVPNEISIIGFDNSPLAEFNTPALTTVGHNNSKIAEEIIKIIEEKRFGVNKLIEPNLIVRDTVK